MQEREAKLEVAPEFTLPELADGDGGVVAKPGSEQRLRTIYYDTPDMRLARWGCNLRYRRGEGWTVKLPGGKDGPLLVRDEHVFKGRAWRPPKAAVELLRAYVRDAELEPVATLRTRRRPVELFDRRGQRLGELADDHVEVLHGHQVARRFRQIEVELVEEAPDDALDGAVERLRGAGAEPANVGSKYLRALGDQEPVAPEVVPTEPERDATALELLRHDLGAAVLRLFRHEPGVRLGEDPEAVHKARVATRRLRSSLRSFHVVLEPGWTARLRAETKWLSDRLGAVRDADVLLARLEHHAGELEEPDARGAERLLRPLHDQRDAARSRLLTAMGERRYTRLLEDLLAAASAPAVLDPGQPAAEALVPLVAKTWRKLRKEVDRAGDDPSDAQLHKIRIRAKRCRYAAEAVVPVAGKPAAQFAAAVEEVQELLGAHHDAVVAEAWLREASGGIRVGKRKKARAAGQLIAMERADAERLRARWPATWDQLDRKKLRAWFS